MPERALICAAIFFAGIAQLVEQLICNQQVVGSNPTAGSLVNRGLTSNIRRSAWTQLGRFSYSKAPKTTYFWVAHPPEFSGPALFYCALRAFIHRKSLRNLDE